MNKLNEVFSPFKFQEFGINRGLDILKNHGSLLLADETGLGKTITSAHIVDRLKNQDGLKNVLVATIKANQPEWRDILSMVDGINFKVTTYNGVPETSLGDIPKVDYDLIIVDEAHNYRNTSGKQYGNLSMLIHKCDCKVILVSATLFQNNVGELKSLLGLLKLSTKSELFYCLGHLVSTLEVVEANVLRHERYKDLWSMDLAKLGKISYLKNLLEKFIVDLGALCANITVRNERAVIKMKYRDDMETMGAFPKENSFSVEYNENNPTLYHTQIDELEFPLQSLSSFHASHFFYRGEWIELNEGGSPNTGIMMTLLGKRLDSSVAAFRASCKRMRDKLLMAKQKFNGSLKIEYNDVEYIIGDGMLFWATVDAEIEKLDAILKIEADDSEKLSKLDDIFDKAGDNKVVVFTEYNETLELLKTYAENRGIYKESLFINGVSKTSEIRKVKKNFDANEKKKSKKYKYLFCTDVLSEGVNLHDAKYAISFDIKYNQSKMVQRKGRISRLRKDKVSADVFIYVFNENPAAAKYVALMEKVKHKTNLTDLFYEGITGEPISFEYLDDDKLDANKVNMVYIDGMDAKHTTLPLTHNGWLLTNANKRMGIKGIKSNLDLLIKTLDEFWNSFSVDKKYFINFTEQYSSIGEQYTITSGLRQCTLFIRYKKFMDNRLLNYLSNPLYSDYMEVAFRKELKGNMKLDDLKFLYFKPQGNLDLAEVRLNDDAGVHFDLYKFKNTYQ